MDPKRGSGFINTLINSLPFEAHIPGYSYLGPGTKLEKRLKRGEIGINLLDQAARAHDIDYQKHKDLKSRHAADKRLEHAAWLRVQSKDAKLGERLAARLTTAIMKVKQRIGAGFQLSTRKKNVVKMKKKRKSKVSRGKRKTKRGGVLPIIPILAGLSTIGSLISGVSAAAKAASISRTNTAKLIENARHNKIMESALKNGKGLYLKPYKTGEGLKKKRKIRKNRKNLKNL